MIHTYTALLNTPTRHYYTYLHSIITYLHDIIIQTYTHY